MEKQKEGYTIVPVVCTVDTRFSESIDKVYNQSCRGCRSCQCQCRLCRGHMTQSVEDISTEEIEKLFVQLLAA